MQQRFVTKYTNCFIAKCVGTDVCENGTNHYTLLPTKFPRSLKYLTQSQEANTCPNPPNYCLFMPKFLELRPHISVVFLQVCQ